MMPLRDLPIPEPLPAGVTEALLFVFFSLHILMALLAVGTAGIAAGLYLDREKFMHPFTAMKSLAVVLGVGPLLLMQAGRSVPFFGATVQNAPLWLAIAALLIVSFTLFEAPAEDFIARRPLAGRALFLAALLTLLAVPAAFTRILSMAEHGSHMLHWLLRYLHVLGAAAVLGAAYHIFFGEAGREAAARARLVRLMIFALAYQLAVGLLLAITLPSGITPMPGIFIVLGAGTALYLLRQLLNRREEFSAVNSRASAVVLVLALLLSMLTARQILQDGAFRPTMEAAAREETAYALRLAPYRAAALASYDARLAAVYDNGSTIYRHSCAFCHGQSGKGDGPEAKGLAVPPADLTTLRMSPERLRAVLQGGVPGTAMPYFSVFDGRKIDSLISYMDDRFWTLGPPLSSKPENAKE